MSIYGAEAVEIVAQRMCDAADEAHGLPESWSSRGESTRDMWRQDARWTLAAAEAALDRETAFRTAYCAIFEANPDGTPGTVAAEARKVIAALFPEGEATDGE